MLKSTHHSLFYPMSKRVLDVGNCDYDHSQLRALIEGQFDAQVVRCHSADDALAELRSGKADLVIVNRLLDMDHSEGMSIIEQIKSDPQLSSTCCMLLTNYPEHQQTAVAAGAELGFGKKELSKPATREKLAKYLS
jgi:CheY-like chemotaxis protein